MLEQPPERSPLEIEAEIAANAQQQQLAPNRAQGCFRIAIWCSPIFVIFIISFIVNSLTMITWRSSASVSQLILIPLCLAAIFGIGYFDGLLSRKAFSPHPSERRSKLLIHATKFLLWQFLIIPGICALLFGACVMIFNFN